MDIQTILASLQGEHSDTAPATALTKCQQLVQQSPDNPDAWQLLGLICAQQGLFEQAVAALQRGVQLAPEQATFYFNLSNAYKRLGKFDLALQYVQHGLQIQPNNPQGYNNLGSLLYSLGQFSAAIPEFSRAIRLSPNIWEAHFNLANCYVKNEQILLAISHYQTVLKLYPQHQDAKVNLAMCLVNIKDYATALPLLEEVAAKNPHHAELQGHLAEAYLELGNSERAIEQYCMALKLLPNRYEWHHNLAVLYLREQKQELAAQHFATARELQPGNPTAQHMLSALQGHNTAQAPIEYVRDLFDQYADYYDQHVKVDLDYQVPYLLRTAISKSLQGQLHQQQVLDLGCGTGICGVYFRDLARFLVGVDISTHMLQQAKKLGAYDGLCCSNILQWIPGETLACFDLVLAADVLVYCGELHTIFSKVKSTLKPQGKLAFTVESNPNLQQPYQLQASGRYRHSHDYIQRLCQELDFDIELHDKITLRTHHQMAIDGILYILAKKDN